jgi:hypothetical protein
MNYFFGYNGNGFKSELTIPKFQNRSAPRSDLRLWSIQSNGEKWVIDLDDVSQDRNFFYVEEQYLNNQKIFILATEEDVKHFNSEKLSPLNKHTSTLPAYRSNFKLIHDKGGFSSYQSEYPSGMVEKKGGIISSIKSLLNLAAEENYILIRNIFHLPIKQSFDAYLIDYKAKKILKKYSLKTNETNCIKIHKKDILPNVFLFTDGFLGIPVYVNQHDGHLSMEHTHPPHSYILSDNVFKKVSELKREFYDIVYS